MTIRSTRPVLGGLSDEDALQGYQVVHFQPFDPVHKRTEATVRAADGTTFKVSKGAPQVILALAADSEQVEAASGARRSAISPSAGFGRWAWLAPTATTTGGSWVCFRCSTRRAMTPTATIATARADGRHGQDGDR